MAEDQKPQQAIETIPPHPDSFDKMDTRNFLNLVPVALQNAFLDAKKKRPELFTMDESTLYDTLHEQSLTPVPLDNRLRMAFWVEYDKVLQGLQNKIQPVSIYAGACTVEAFYSSYLKNPSRVAWMLCPPASYEASMEEALGAGVALLRRILQKDPEKYGKDKMKLMELQVKIVMALDQRVKGAVVQRIEQKNMNLHFASNDPKLAQRAVESSVSMESLDQKLRELSMRENRLRQSRGMEPIPYDSKAEPDLTPRDLEAELAQQE